MHHVSVYAQRYFCGGKVSVGLVPMLIGCQSWALGIYRRLDIDMASQITVNTAKGYFVWTQNTVLR